MSDLEQIIRIINDGILPYGLDSILRWGLWLDFDEDGNICNYSLGE